MLAAVGYLIKTLLSSRLERESDAFKAELKRSADVEIERLRSSLQMEALEHRVRFSKLHEQRVDVISRLSTEIEEVPAAVQIFVLNVKQPAALEVARDRTFELFRLSRLNRTILPASVCAMLEQYSRKLMHIVSFVSVYWTAVENPTPETVTKRNEIMLDAVSALEGDIPALKEKLIVEFRTLLAGENAKT
ncbi:MAG: hypothetical protein WBF06_12790 [Candidatus Acidiferrales bacterium]